MNGWLDVDVERSTAEATERKFGERLERERERNRLTDTDSQKERKKQEKKNKIKEKQATVGFSRLFRSSGWLRQRQKGCYGYDMDMDMDMPCLVLSRRPSK